MFKKFIFVVFFLFSLTGISFAEVIYSNEGPVIIAAEETLQGPVFLSGDTVEINGTIDGALFAAGKEVIINGTVNGDIFTAAQSITLNGSIKGDVHSASQNLQIVGNVEGDCMSAAQTVQISPGANIGRDAMVASKDFIHAGTINRQLFAAASTSTISGVIYDNAKLSIEKLQLLNGSNIKGNLFYWSPNQASQQPNAKIIGETKWHKTEPQGKRNLEKQQKSYADNIISMLIGILGALLVWFLLTLIKPDLWDKITYSLKKRPLETLGIGFIALLFIPIIVLILLLTIIGIPLGILLAIMYGVSIYLSKIILSVFVGYWLSERFAWSIVHKGVWLVLLGLFIITALSSIPILGFFITGAVITFGMGSILQFIIKAKHIYE